MFYKTDGPFYFTSSLPLPLYHRHFYLWVYKRIWHPNPDKMVLLRHLLGLQAFQIKKYSLRQHLVSDLVSDSLAYCVTRRVSLDFVTVATAGSHKYCLVNCKKHAEIESIDSMDMNLSKFREIVWHATVHEVTKSWTRLSNGTI